MLKYIYIFECKFNQLYHLKLLPDVTWYLKMISCINLMRSFGFIIIIFKAQIAKMISFLTIKKIHKVIFPYKKETSRYAIKIIIIIIIKSKECLSKYTIFIKTSNDNRYAQPHKLFTLKQKYQ